LRITFFVVGQDAVLDTNRATIQSIAAGGHEIANHSFSHEPSLHLYSQSHIEEELARTEEEIVRLTGRRPVGFRAPGFSWSDTLLKVLAQRGYLYDASTLPTWIAPLARSYYFRASKFAAHERGRRDVLFGEWKHVFRPLKAHIIQRHPQVLVEVPVTTMPIFRVPFHVSYIVYLSSVSPAAALAYFKLALALCRITNVQPSLLLHPLDFLGADDVHGLEFFPGMGLSSSQKVKFVRTSLKAYCDTFAVVSMREHARAVLSLATRQPADAIDSQIANP
jgi:peptidoglycan-N-acetylglucosamine deacetylase